MRSIWFAVGLAAACAPALAEDVKAVTAPSFKIGDLWVYDQTMEKGPTGFNQFRVDLAIERLNDTTMMVGIKRDGAPTAYEDHMVGQDWSQRRVVDGEETVTTRPLTFPMSPGQNWTIDFNDTIRRGNQLSVRVHRVYKVVGWQEVVVPAGTFRALKVEANGVDKATVEVPAAAVSGALAQSNGATTIAHTQPGGRNEVVRQIYGEFYYVPEIKATVKSVEEQYTPDNVRVSRETRALVSYKPAG